jgi:tetratricopeptide (TPR) repeat protein
MSNPARDIEVGLELCRKGEWAAGVQSLARGVESLKASRQVPSQAYSFLGYGLAREQRRFEEGLNLCRHALRRDYSEAENHLNIARLHLLMANRNAAVKAVAEGLEFHPGHPGLAELQRDMGRRGRPALRFLRRSNPVNRWLGRLRERMRHGG